jgi:hypothetical protein
VCVFAQAGKEQDMNSMLIKSNEHGIKTRRIYLMEFISLTAAKHRCAISNAVALPRSALPERGIRHGLVHA